MKGLAKIFNYLSTQPELHCSGVEQENVKQIIPPAFCFEDTDLHAGEITAMSPGKPATAGTLVNIHILKVHIHTNNPPVDEKKKKEQEEIRKRKCKSLHGNQWGVGQKDI